MKHEHLPPPYGRSATRLRWVAAALAAALALGCDRRPSKGPSGAFRTAQTTTEVAAAAKPSVAALTLVDKAGKNCGAGTGFFIEGGRLVTNWHVAGLGRGGTGRLPDGTTFGLVAVVAEDRASDLAILTTDLPEGAVTGLPLLSTPPPEGTDVLVIGNPLGLGQAVSDGIVSATVGPNGEAGLIRITAPISPGSSGSPVLDHQAKVIGVVSGMLTGGQNLNIAVSADRVLALRGME